MVFFMIGKHWTAEQVANTFAPHQETKDAVTDWLIESGIDRSRLSFSTGTPTLIVRARDNG